MVQRFERRLEAELSDPELDEEPEDDELDERLR